MTCAPCWWAATSKAHRVRVEAFSKITRDVRLGEPLALVAGAHLALELLRQVEQRAPLVGGEVELLEEAPAVSGSVVMSVHCFSLDGTGHAAGAAAAAPSSEPTTGMISMPSSVR